MIRALGTQERDPAKGSSGLHSVERIQRLLVTWGATSQTARSQSAKVAAEALQSEEKFGSALSLVRAAQRTATSLRERLSPDAWLGWLVIIGSIPVAVVGLLFKKQIEGTFTKNLVVIATMMIVIAILLGTAEFVGQQRRRMGELGIKDSLAVGFAQCLALIPGSSRSGSGRDARYPPSPFFDAGSAPFGSGTTR